MQAVVEHHHVGARVLVTGKVEQVALLEAQALLELVLANGALGRLAGGAQVPDFAADLRVAAGDLGDVGTVAASQVDDRLRLVKD
ncbi:hypothetical protein D3C72_1904910 [compost metagenome]